jgi:hypothetical protein
MVSLRVGGVETSQGAPRPASVSAMQPDRISIAQRPVLNTAKQATWQSGLVRVSPSIGERKHCTSRPAFLWPVSDAVEVQLKNNKQFIPRPPWLMCTSITRATRAWTTSLPGTHVNVAGPLASQIKRSGVREVRPAPGFASPGVLEQGPLISVETGIRRMHPRWGTKISCR